MGVFPFYPSPSPPAAVKGAGRRKGRPTKIPSFLGWAMHDAGSLYLNQRTYLEGGEEGLAVCRHSRLWWVYRTQLCVCGCVGVGLGWARQSWGPGAAATAGTQTSSNGRVARRSVHDPAHGQLTAHPNHATNNRSPSQIGTAGHGRRLSRCGKGGDAACRPGTASSESTEPAACLLVARAAASTDYTAPLQTAVGEKSIAGRQIQGGCKPQPPAREGMGRASWHMPGKKGSWGNKWGLFFA